MLKVLDSPALFVTVEVAGAKLVIIGAPINGVGFTVTTAFPATLPFVAFTTAVPGTNAVNVVVALPFTSVTALDGFMVPTVVLLLVQDMLIPDIGLLF